MNKYFHNPRCSKSRQGLAILENNNIKLTIIEYLKEGISQKDFLDIIERSGLSPLEGLVRTKEALFKELDLKGKEFSNKEWAKLISENPKLLERPILQKDTTALLGRQPENINSIR